MLYCLKLLSIFSIIKLTITSDNPISERHFNFFLDLIIINKEEK